MRIVLAGILLCAGAWASDHSHGYAFGAIAGIPGRSPFTFWGGSYVQGGAGGEVAIGEHFTGGGELAALISTREQYARSGAIASAGPMYHLLKRSSGKADPFVGGGVSLLVSNGAGAMLYYGGGVNYWFRDRIGFRAEFRDHIWRDGIHFVSGRFGLCFR